MPLFVLDQSALGGNGFNYHESVFEDRTRSIQLTWTQSGLDQDMELFGYSVRFDPGDPEAQEPS